MKIKFCLSGSCSPSITIFHNKEALWQGVIDQVELEFSIELSCHDVIGLSGIGKRNGEDGIYDTKVDDQGRIIADKFLTIDDIVIEDISMGIDWIKSINTIENFSSNSIYHNGIIEICPTNPVMHWIIEEKIIKKQKVNMANTEIIYNGDDRFEYEYIKSKIIDIKKMLGNK